MYIYIYISLSICRYWGLFPCHRCFHPRDSACAEVVLLPGWSLAEPHFADGFRYYGRRGSEDELDHPDLLSFLSTWNSKWIDLGREQFPNFGVIWIAGVPFSPVLHSYSAFFPPFFCWFQHRQQPSGRPAPLPQPVVLPARAPGACGLVPGALAKALSALGLRPPFLAQCAAAQRGGSDEAAAVAAAGTWWAAHGVRHKGTARGEKVEKSSGCLGCAAE